MSAALRNVLLCSALICGCAGATPTPADQTQATSEGAHTMPSSVVESPSPLPAPALDARRGQEVGLEFEAFLSPHQESDEEENTPSSTPAVFRSTTPSQSRAQREAAGHRGHGVVRFSRDFSRAFIDVKVEGVDVSTINMFHIHCGRPGILGPILLDFALATDIKKNLADGVLSVEIRNEHIVGTSQHGHGLISAFTQGCIIPSPSLGSFKPSKVSTVAGMAELARDGQLYFNLHTTGQTYFGDMRGQLQAAQKAPEPTTNAPESMANKK